MGTAAMSAAPPAFADAVDDGAKKFADSVYPLLGKVDFERGPVIAKYFQDELKNQDPQKAALFIDKLLDAGLSMNPKLIARAIDTHERALDLAVNSPGLVVPKETFE